MHLPKAQLGLSHTNGARLLFLVIKIDLLEHCFYKNNQELFAMTISSLKDYNCNPKREFPVVFKIKRFNRNLYLRKTYLFQ